MQRGTPMRRGLPMKSRHKARQKVDGIDYLGLCRGQQCFLMLPRVVFHDIETVVPAHSNQQRHGKGVGIKANDKFTVPACMTCHFEIDQGKSMTKAEKFAAWDAAYERWEKVRARLLRSEP